MQIINKVKLIATVGVLTSGLIMTGCQVLRTWRSSFFPALQISRRVT